MTNHYMRTEEERQEMRAKADKRIRQLGQQIAKPLLEAGYKVERNSEGVPAWINGHYMDCRIDKFNWRAGSCDITEADSAGVVQPILELKIRGAGTHWSTFRRRMKQDGTFPVQDAIDELKKRADWFDAMEKRKEEEKNKKAQNAEELKPMGFVIDDRFGSVDLTGAADSPFNWNATLNEETIKFEFRIPIENKEAIRKMADLIREVHPEKA